MRARKITTVLVAVLLLSAGLVAVTAVAVNAEDPKQYTVDINPTLVEADSTETYTVEIGLDPLSNVTLGAVRLTVPTELTVDGLVAVSPPDGKVWTDPADPLGDGTWESLAATQADRLDPNEFVTFEFSAEAVSSAATAVFAYDIRQANNFNGALNVIDPHPTGVETEVMIVEGTIVSCTAGSCEGSQGDEGEPQVAVAGTCTSTEDEGCGVVIIDLTACPGECEGGIAAFWNPEFASDDLTTLEISFTIPLDGTFSPNSLDFVLQKPDTPDETLDFCKKGPNKNVTACILDFDKTKTTATWVVLADRDDPLGFVTK